MAQKDNNKGVLHSLKAIKGFVDSIRGDVLDEQTEEFRDIVAIIEPLASDVINVIESEERAAAEAARAANAAVEEAARIEQKKNNELNNLISDELRKIESSQFAVHNNTEVGPPRKVPALESIVEKKVAYDVNSMEVDKDPGYQADIKKNLNELSGVITDTNTVFTEQLKALKLVLNKIPPISKQEFDRHIDQTMLEIATSRNEIRIFRDKLNDENERVRSECDEVINKLFNDVYKELHELLDNMKSAYYYLHGGQFTCLCRVPQYNDLN